MNHFELNDSAFHAALAKASSQLHECCFRLAGKNVQLSVIGDVLFQMIEQAFSHLLIKDYSANGADLRIRLWDEYVTGIACPIDPPESLHSLNGHIYKSDDGSIVSHYREQIYCTLDRKNKSIIGASKGAQHMSLFDRGKPLHALIGVWLNDLQMPFLHGGVIVNRASGVLLCGSGGSGKSTTAIACLEEGWEYLGDDAVAIEQTDTKKFIAHSIYASTTLEPDHMQNFGRLIPHAIQGSNPGEDKDLVIVSKLYPGQLKRSAVIKALVIPKVTDKSIPRIFPIKKIKALLAMAPSSILYLPNAGDSYLNLLGNITQSVPCYSLELGKDISMIPECMSSILNEMR